MAGAWKLPKKVLSLCQAGCLLWAIIRHGVLAVCCSVASLFRICLGSQPEICDGVEFYEGTVMHSRAHEGEHSFTYSVRMAVVDLDSPPHWFTPDPGRRLTSDLARAAAGTAGRVRLLTVPVCAGYDQNPIQVYYCEDKDGSCKRAVAEVTNTPWNHRVQFAFDNTLGDGALLAKPLHVSPLMDIDQRWRIRAPTPKDGRIEVDVDVLSPLGESNSKSEQPLLRARLRLKKSGAPRTRTEYGASLSDLWSFGLQPHRTAVGIYMNAILLLRKGIKFRGHPPPNYKDDLLSRGKAFSACGADPPQWADNSGFPWGARFSGKKS